MNEEQPVKKPKYVRAKPRRDRSWPQNARACSLNFLPAMWETGERQFIPNSDYMVLVRKYTRALKRMKRQSDRIKTLLEK